MRRSSRLVPIASFARTRPGAKTQHCRTRPPMIAKQNLCQPLLLPFLLIFPFNICSRVPSQYTPPWYGPPWPWPRDTRSQHEAVQDYFPSIFPFYPHLVESPANTIGFSTCKDYDPHQLSITPTRSHYRSTGGGGVQTMTMAGGEGVCATL